MSEFELVEFVEAAFREGDFFSGTRERIVDVFNTESAAIEAGRREWSAFRVSGSQDVAWWVVRVPGESLARWIADGGSPVERVLDLRTNTLVEMQE